MTDSNATAYEPWWRTQDVLEQGTLIPSVSFVIECTGCGELYEASSLRGLPESCPTCGKENTYDR